MEHKDLLTIVLWGLGTCVTGFFFLLAWIINVTAGFNKLLEAAKEDRSKIKKSLDVELIAARDDRMKIKGSLELELAKKVSFSDLNQTMEKTNILLQQIKDAVVGDFEQPGIIRDISNIKDKVKSIEDNCKEHINRTRPKTV